MSSKKIRNLEIGERLREVRKKAALTQEGLAVKVGCSGENISSIERGEWGPSGSLVANLVRELGLNEKWLTNGTEPIYKEGQVAESPEPYGGLSKPDRKLLKKMAEALEFATKDQKELLLSALKCFEVSPSKKKGREE